MNLYRARDLADLTDATSRADYNGAERWTIIMTASRNSFAQSPPVRCEGDLMRRLRLRSQGRIVAALRGKCNGKPYAANHLVIAPLFGCSWRDG